MNIEISRYRDLTDRDYYAPLNIMIEHQVLSQPGEAEIMMVAGPSGRMRIVIEGENKLVERLLGPDFILRAAEATR